MPYGPGTYGSKVGRPPKKFKTGGKLTDEERELRNRRQKTMMGRSNLTSGPRKRRSSKELKAALNINEKARADAAKRKYGDKGRAGLDSQIEEGDAALDRLVQDRELIEEYGEDAPKARGYGTIARTGDQPSIKELWESDPKKKKGGKVKKKKSYSRGGKVRGAGKASQGVRKCKYVSMKGS